MSGNPDVKHGPSRNDFPLLSECTAWPIRDRRLPGIKFQNLLDIVAGRVPVNTLKALDLYVFRYIANPAEPAVLILEPGAASRTKLLNIATLFGCSGRTFCPINSSTVFIIFLPYPQ
jgi:hypothetical protein